MAQGKVARPGRPVLFVCGGVLLLTGVTLILVWWPAVVSLFKGLVGMCLALGGLLVLYMIKE